MWMGCRRTSPCDDPVAVTTSAGFYVRMHGGDPKLVTSEGRRSCATDEALIERPAQAWDAPTTTAQLGSELRGELTVVGSRRTDFVDPTTGDWFAATGMKGAESPPFATRSDDRGLVFSPERGGGTWTLRAYPIHHR